MALAWLVAIRTGRSGWIDAIWSLAVGAGGIAGSLMPFNGTDAISPRQWLVAGLAAIWSLRLGCHLAARTIRGGDDPRYTQLRKEWRDDFQRRLFWVLQIQAAAALILDVTILTAARHPVPDLGFGDLSGVVIFLVVVIGEASRIGSFRASALPLKTRARSAILGFGATHATRIIDFSGAYPWGFIALAGPILMYWLLIHVSGIPPLEAHMLRSRGDRFRDYQQRVHAFWPALQKGLPTDTPGGAR
jgi:steroid 5-alpha reductase family enzyme